MPGKLTITGEVSIEPCKSISNPNSAWYILILGPTGAGKSSFIEALAGEGQSLGISKDQLAGFTQDVTAYGVKNAIVEWDIYTQSLYLIDAPGFSDSKISELEIITKVKQWMTDQHVSLIDGVLYLSPITDTRAPGSKRRTIKMIQSLLYNGAFDCLGIVTTMWDRVSNPQAEKRAEANFAQLRDDIWKRPISQGAKISRYHNDFDSAIQILQSVIKSAGGFAPLHDKRIQPGDASAAFLYQELLDCITSAQQEKELLRQDKMQLIRMPDPQLESVVLSRLPGVKDDLAKFLGQLVAFGTPPPGFEGIPERCVYQDLLDHVNEAREEQAALTRALADLHTNPDRFREATLTQQLDLVQLDLVQRVTTLLQRGIPPEGYEKALEHALEPPVTLDEVLPLWSPPSSSGPVPNVPNPTADSDIMSTDLIPDRLTTHATAAPPPGFEGIPEQHDYQSLLDHVKEAQEKRTTLNDALAHLQTHPDLIQEKTLRGQLSLVERELAQHVKRLVMFGAPKGYEKDVEHVIERLIWTRPSDNAIPNILAPAADSSAT